MQATISGSQAVSDLKVAVSVHARYHAFRLAEGLSHYQMLDRLYTIYPKFKIPPYKIPSAHVKSFSLLGALRYLDSCVGSSISARFITAGFDGFVARSLARPVGGQWIFHGWNGFAEQSLIKAKKLDAITVLERSCPHVDFQLELLAEEKSRLLKKSFLPEKNEFVAKVKREYELADYIIVPSRYSFKSFVERGFSASKILIVALCNEKLTLEPRRPRDPGKFTVLCVGGEFYRKGLYYLLRAWQALNLRDGELVVKGTIPDEFAELRTIRNMRLIDHHLTDNQMAELYQAASIFVLPSIDDGFGMVVVEAMAAGLPVIVTENVGAADVISEAEDGFVVPARSIEAVKEKIAFFYENPQRIREMGRAALIKAQGYSPDAYIKRMVGAYENMVATADFSCLQLKSAT
jgi:glycosyltransferase involved in cell wall biosynthesis